MLPSKDFFRKYAQEKNIPWQEKNILMEYLQAQVLKTLSLSKCNEAISFLGGTCLRFIYGIDRFSEDLDFDLVEKKNFKIEKLAEELRTRLELQGFALDIKIKTTENIHIIFLKFKGVLQEFGFKVSRDEKFLIKFEIDYNSFKNMRTAVRFADIFNERFPLLVNSLETIFAQKIIALRFRPYQKGRDFYDLIWFLAQKNIEPNYALLAEKGINIKNREELKAELKKIIAGLNLKQAAKDVRRFLFYPERAGWIENFGKYLESF